MLVERTTKLREHQVSSDWFVLYLVGTLFSMPFIAYMIVNNISIIVLIAMALVGIYIFSSGLYSIFEFDALKNQKIKYWSLEDSDDQGYFSSQLTSFITCIAYVVLVLTEFVSKGLLELACDVTVLFLIIGAVDAMIRSFLFIKNKQVKDINIVKEEKNENIVVSSKEHFPFVESSTDEKFQHRITKMNEKLSLLTTYFNEIEVERSHSLSSSIGYLNEALSSFEQLCVDEKAEMKHELAFCFDEVERQINEIINMIQESHKENIVKMKLLLSKK